jgi:acyl-CoA dehydrogenase family protein 9
VERVQRNRDVRPDHSQESYGGSGLGLSDYLGIIEAAAAPTWPWPSFPWPIIPSASKALSSTARKHRKRNTCPPAATGETIFAYALTEPETGSDAKNIKDFRRKVWTAAIIFERHQNLYHKRRLCGCNDGLCPDGQKPGFMGAFIVETGWEGVEIGKDMPKMGLKVSSTAMIKFNNVKVPAENLMGKPGDGFKIAMTILNYGRLGLAAASNGLMTQSAREMLERADQRKQFGVPISQFELVQEKS